jgi:hypothetical protein
MFATIKNLIPEPRQASQPRRYVGRHRQPEPVPQVIPARPVAPVAPVVPVAPVSPSPVSAATAEDRPAPVETIRA